MADDDHQTLRSELSRQAAIDEFRNRPENETGWNRLKEMYTVKRTGFASFEFSPELAAVETALKLSGAAGFLTGFFNQWKTAKEAFIRQNRASKFLGQKDFARQGYDFQIKSSFRHGTRFGVRLGLFTGLYCLSTSTLAIYNNRLGMTEYAVSGVLAGALWQGRIGLRGVVMGGTVGGLLSLVAGLACVTVLKTNNQDLATLRYELHFERLKAWEQRDRLKAEWAMKKMLEDAKKEIKDGKVV